MSDEKLKKEFEILVKETHKKIDEQLKIAKKALDEAVKIANKNGVSFSSNISYIGGNDYTAKVKDKFEELDEEFIADTTGVYPGKYNGWAHSSVCW